MTIKEYREKVNPCYGCDCCDEDTGGCTMPSIDRMYACSLETKENGQDEEDNDN